MKYIFLLVVGLFILASCNQEQSSMETNSTGNTGEITASEPIENNLDEQNKESPDSKPMSYSFYTGEDVLVNVYPISHATIVVEWGDTTIYVDPAEPTESYKGFNDPDMIFITHIHGDHLKQEVLEELYQRGVALVVPESVNAELNQELQEYTTVMNIETSQELGMFNITTVPAYNIREDALDYHPQDRADNGYIIENEGLRMYFSGDSEDTPEMRALEDIDIAFVSMNLPYTMTVDSAASAILQFAPKTVFPYHYRGTDGQSDVQRFKELVNTDNTEINVVLHDWYLGE